MIFHYVCRKMTKNERFQNGQIPGEFLAELSVCYRDAEALVPLSTVETLWKERRSMARARLLRLFEGIDLAMGRIPRSQGFFTSAADRKQTFLAVCSFLELFQKESILLDRESLGFGEVYSLLRHRERAILQIEARGLELQRAFGKQADQEGLKSAQDLLQGLLKEKENDAALLTALRRTEAALCDFLTGTCVEFCRFAAAKADVEHDGAEASPAEISRLLWGLRQETEKLLREL